MLYSLGDLKLIGRRSFPDLGKLPGSLFSCRTLPRPRDSWSKGAGRGSR